MLKKGFLLFGLPVLILGHFSLKGIESSKYTLKGLLEYIKNLEETFFRPQARAYGIEIKKFVDAGVPVDKADPNDPKKETALHGIARIPHPSIYPLIEGALSGKNYNINVKNSQGQTPLYVAAENLNNLAASVDRFLAAGADPNIASNDGTTPLSIAVEKNNMRAVEELLDRTLRIKTSTKNIRDALARAQKSHSDTDIINLLKQAVENSSRFENAEELQPTTSAVTPTVQEIKQPAPKKVSPLSQGLIDLVKKSDYSNVATQIGGYINAMVRPDELVPTGGKHQITKKVNGEMEKENVEGEESALHWIALNKSASPHDISRVMKAVLKTPQLNINVQNSYGQTPLYLAAENTHNTAALDELLAAGANPNIASISGTTPLHIAAEKGNIDAVNKLLKAGAKTDIQNIYGSDALASAQRFKGDTHTQQEIIKILTKKS